MSVWCDNCLLLFPLRGGAMALALFIALYSIAGSIFLFMRGEFFYFMSYEAYVYGGIGMAVGFIALLNLLGLANQSYMWNRVMFYVGPLLIFLCAIRAGLMVFRLNYYQADIAWECAHGGQVYNSTLANETWYTGNGTTGATEIPTYFCTYGWNTVYLAFAFSVVIDCLIQHVGDHDPLSRLDNCVDVSTLVACYVLDQQDPDRLVERLDRAAIGVVSKWRMLAGRLRRNNKATRWEIDIPPHPVPTGYVTHTLTRSTIYASLPLPPKPTASAAFLVPALPLSHFRHSASPMRSVSYASKNKPFLAIHVSVLPNCICVGISLPHGVVDATGFGMVVSALDAELNGREWEVPSSDGVVEAMAEEAKAKVAAESRGTEFISTGDVLVAWLLKTAHAAEPSNPNLIGAFSYFSLRPFLHPPLPSHPHNCFLPSSVPFLSIAELSTLALHSLALLHRRSLISSRSPSSLAIAFRTLAAPPFSGAYMPNLHPTRDRAVDHLEPIEREARPDRLWRRRGSWSPGVRDGDPAGDD